jgi:hypothetical protein
MVQSTIEFKITFDTSTTSYYNMLDRMVKVLKDELRKAYYDIIDETTSESESDPEAEESIFTPDFKHVDEVIARLDVSSVSSNEIEVNEFNLNH